MSSCILYSSVFFYSFFICWRPQIGGRKLVLINYLVRERCFYLTIRLRARNFYEVIVNEDETQVNYRFIDIERYSPLLDIYWRIDSE